MISDKEFLEIIQGLYEKTTKEPNVAWQQKQMVQGAFFLKLPTSVITIQHVRPTAEPDFITFTLARDVGSSALATKKVYEGDLGWDTLFDLYALVSRKASGWDNVWKDVQKFLGKTTTPAIS